MQADTREVVRRVPGSDVGKILHKIQYTDYIPSGFIRILLIRISRCFFYKYILLIQLDLITNAGKME